MSMRVEEVSNSGVELAWIPQADSLESKTDCQTVSTAQDVSIEMVLIPCLMLRASTIVGRIEAACPR